MAHPVNSSPALARDCLVAVVTNDSDLERFRTERWYRIPDRALGLRLARTGMSELKALALYQTSGIRNGLPSSIEMWGEIERVDRMTRRELIPEEPDHPSAEELYHRIGLRSIHPLERPLFSRRPRRISFLRTSCEQLFTASDIGDLILGSPAEERLLARMRQENLQVDRKVYMKIGGKVTEVDFGIYTPEGTIGLVCGLEEYDIRGSRCDDPSLHILRFSPEAIDQEVEQCLVEILSLVDRLRSHRGEVEEN